MIATGVTQETFLAQLEGALNANYTEEQEALVKHFGDGPAFCFADPGTGKTFTAVGGLINAELFKQIPGDNIYALSFTRLATGELAVRHENACRKLGISRNINFKTLHSLCRTILMENADKLGITDFKMSGSVPMKESFVLVDETCREWGIEIDPNTIRQVIRACQKLNSSLIFDPVVVETKMDYKLAKIDYPTFDRIRGLLFAANLLSENISVSDLLLYTVILLQRNPEISEAFKKKCRLLLVDEAQDLSLLQLRIISLLTDNPIMIGDMKQQIYGFNGACQEIVQRFFELYPNAKLLKLTQSFRCRNEIADFATKIILPNKIGGEDYKGIGEGGIIHICDPDIGDWHFNMQEVAKQMQEEFLNNGHRFERDYMFLARNNISITPIVEELYQAKVPFRMNQFTPGYEVPVVKELCELLKLCDQPDDPRNCMALRYLIPEFREYKSYNDHPYYKICHKQACNIFEVNYQFKDPRTADKAFSALMDVAGQIKTGGFVSSMFNTLWQIYYDNWLNARIWMLEQKPKYYTNSVQCLTHKTYREFMMDEVKKKNINDEDNRYGRGVKCYTMHASKGLEADVVYIIDADVDIIPNTHKLQDMEKKQCFVDAARSIREERSLCYVACTRAREELYIVSSELSPIMLGKGVYGYLDKYYEMCKSSGDDISAFMDFSKRHVEQYIKAK